MSATADVAPALREIKAWRTGKAENRADMARKFPLNPPHPERNCWGCDTYCPAGSLVCGNGSERTQHPVELFGEDWARSGLDPFADAEGKPATDAAQP